MSTRQKVLCIDDEKVNLKIFSDILKDDVDVIMAKSGEQGIRKAIELKPDLILLDITMPGMDGFETIIQLKNNPQSSAIPVIFVTGELDINKEERGFELGACDCIQKPFHAVSLKARVVLHLELARQRHLLEHMVNFDPLTSIANRRRYDEVLNVEYLNARKEQSVLSVAMIDIDFFKPYNDHYGHDAGDKALRSVAQVLSEQLQRSGDFVARYGGEEFVVILAKTDQNGAQAVLEACCKAVEGLGIEHLKSENSSVLTVSIGGSCCIPQQFSDVTAALKIADQYLYKAKRNGKNQVVWQEAEDLSLNLKVTNSA